MKSAMRARKGSMDFTISATRKSLHFPSSSSLLFPMDAIWSSASSPATRSQVKQSEIHRARCLKLLQIAIHSTSDGFRGCGGHGSGRAGLEAEKLEAHGSWVPRWP